MAPSLLTLWWTFLQKDWGLIYMYVLKKYDSMYLLPLNCTISVVNGKFFDVYASLQ
jgi:hypothetical protein